MSKLFMASLLCSIVSCGIIPDKNLKNDNEDLKEENDRLNQQIKEKEVSEAKQKTEMQKKISDAEKQAADADLAKRNAEESRKNYESSKNQIKPLLGQFEGVWILESDSAESLLSATCSKFVHIDSTKVTINQIVVCDTNKAQITTLTPSEFKVRGDLFPGSLGLSILGNVATDSCKQNKSIYSKLNQIVLDQSTGSGGQSASMMFAFDTSNTESVFENTSGHAEFKKTNQCSDIIKLAASAENQNKKILQRAAKACNQSQLETGCFTSSGFIK